MNVDVLATGGRYAVIQARGAARPELPVAHEGHEAHASLLPFEPNLVLARQQANLRSSSRAMDPRVMTLIEEVDPQRWFNDVVTLAGYNRYTFGTEIDAARDWLVQQLEGLSGLAVATESFQVGARPRGMSSRPCRALSGLTISTSSVRITMPRLRSPQSAAPGAEDNASGCAGVLEMARIFAAHPPASTILFICYSGEEQGLFGSSDHGLRFGRW